MARNILTFPERLKIYNELQRLAKENIRFSSKNRLGLHLEKTLGFKSIAKNITKTCQLLDFNPDTLVDQPVAPVTPETMASRSQLRKLSSNLRAVMRYFARQLEYHDGAIASLLLLLQQDKIDPVEVQLLAEQLQVARTKLRLRPSFDAGEIPGLSRGFSLLVADDLPDAGESDDNSDHE